MTDTSTTMTAYPIIENRDLGEGWWELRCEAPELAPLCRAGQFVQVRIGEGYDPLLRRPFSVYDVGPEPGPNATEVCLLYQVVGPGTRWMSHRRVGDRIDLLGPLGNPFPSWQKLATEEIFLVGGGIGVAPLYFYSRELTVTAGAPVPTVLIGARRESLLIGRDRFEALGVPFRCATDDGSFGVRGNVVELLHESLAGASSPAGIGCGPHGMNVALRNLAVERDLPFWISLENYMPCGFGACYGCVIEVPGSDPKRYRRVCVEGPAFPAAEIPAE